MKFRSTAGRAASRLEEVMRLLASGFSDSGSGVVQKRGESSRVAICRRNTILERYVMCTDAQSRQESGSSIRTIHVVRAS